MEEGGYDGTKKSLPGACLTKPLVKCVDFWGKLADHVGDHLILLPEGAVLVPSPGTE